MMETTLQKNMQNIKSFPQLCCRVAKTIANQNHVLLQSLPTLKLSTYFIDQITESKCKNIKIRTMLLMTHGGWVINGGQGKVQGFTFNCISIDKIRDLPGKCPGFQSPSSKKTNIFNYNNFLSNSISGMRRSLKRLSLFPSIILQRVPLDQDRTPSLKTARNPSFHQGVICQV